LAYGNQPTAEDAWRDALARFGKAPTWADLSQSPFVQLFDLKSDPHEGLGTRTTTIVSHESVTS
jgi:hypothetical protein